MAIRVIVLDVDGVMVPKETSSVMPSPLIEKVRNLEARGVKCGMASGRGVDFIRGISNIIGMSGPLIAECGSVVLVPSDFQGRGVMEAEGFTVEEASELKEMLREKIKDVDFDISRFKLYEACLLPANKADSGELYEKAREALKGKNVTLFHSGISVDITKGGIDKGVAIKRASELMRIPLREFAAVGDSDNDIDMMVEAGFSGCPGDALPKVKEIADYVAKEDGPEGTLEVLEYMEERGMLP
jgi:phosphoglycolate phosphatase (TIGR01487 family)